MLKNKSLLAPTTLLGFATLAVLALSGCGGEDQATVDRHVIPVNISAEEKVIFVNNFVNLTDNQDLNLFEDGIADMLEERLPNLHNVEVVPRDSIKKLLAASDSSEELSIVNVARGKGVQYIIDGWISATEKGTYKAYANLISVEGDKEEIHNKFAAVEFVDRDNALEEINGLIEEIAGKISRNREEFESQVNYKDFDYNFFNTYHNAVSTANRGRPDLAISQMETLLANYLKKAESATDEKHSGEFHKMTTYARFLLAEMYTETGDHNSSLAHIEAMNLNEEQRKEMGMWSILLDAMRDENTGRYTEAAQKYRQLAEKKPYENFFYQRLAEVTLEETGDHKKALEIAEEGLRYVPNSFSLHKQAESLRMQIEGEKAIEEYVAENADNHHAMVTNEVVSSLINKRLEEEILSKNPVLMPLVVSVESAEDGSFVRVGRVNVDIEKLEHSVDYSCPDTTDTVVKMANLAVRSGNVKFAYQVAENIRVHGTAPNSMDAYHTIYAFAKTADGDFDAAKKHAIKISEDQSARYLVIGNILLHRGSNKKAAKYMEKALKLEKHPHPLLYYNIANAHLLAGHYKEWNKYNEKFLETSVKLGLITESLKKRILALPRERLSSN